MRFVQFSYYKTANCITPWDVVHYYLQCNAVMPFCEWFWCDFCGLCGLVNLSSIELGHFFFFFNKITYLIVFYILHREVSPFLPIIIPFYFSMRRGHPKKNKRKFRSILCKSWPLRIGKHVMTLWISLNFRG